MKSFFAFFFSYLVLVLFVTLNTQMILASHTKNPIKVHGHRGSRGTHPENSIPAFEEAIDAGADVLELDMLLTKDDVVVVTHDEELSNRLCQDETGTPLKNPIPVRSLTLAELKKLNCGSIPNPSFPKQKRISNLKIPTLTEVLSLWKKKGSHLELNIETKMGAKDPSNNPDPALFVSLVLDQLKKFSAVNSTILQSFDFRTLKVAKQLAPSLRLSCLFEFESNFAQLSALEGAMFASPDFKLVTPLEIQKSHEKKLQVVPWTLNTPEDWRKAIEMGVDAIITDYPRQLVQMLKSGKKS